MRHERGFTLLEILVALVLIGLLAGVLVPTVANQITRGETDRVVEDLGAIETAVKAFRVDVQRWPLQIRHLASAPSAAAPDSALGATSNSLYPAGLITKWRGPYLERGSIPDTLVTAAGGVVLGQRLTVTTWGTAPFVTIKTKGITQANARAIRLIVDGDTAVGNTPYTAAMTGKVRWTTGDTLVYLMSPL